MKKQKLISTILFTAIFVTTVRSGQDDIPLNTVEEQSWNFNFNLKFKFGLSKGCKETVAKTIEIAAKLETGLTNLPADNITALVTKLLPQLAKSSVGGASANQVKTHQFPVNWSGFAKTGEAVSVQADAVVTIDEKHNASLSLKNATVSAQADNRTVTSNHDNVVGLAKIQEGVHLPSEQDVHVIKTDKDQKGTSGDSHDSKASVDNTDGNCIFNCGGKSTHAIVSVDKWALMPEGAKTLRQLEKEEATSPNVKGNSSKINLEDSRKSKSNSSAGEGTPPLQAKNGETIATMAGVGSSRSKKHAGKRKNPEKSRKRVDKESIDQSKENSVVVVVPKTELASKKDKANPNSKNKEFKSVNEDVEKYDD
jgi:predicted RNA-binding protein with RPS1 domain